jgi:hypothetical protein
MLALLVAACSSSHERDPRTTQIRRACRVYRPGEAPFDFCVITLEKLAPKQMAALLSNNGVAYVAPDDGGNDNHKRDERACFAVGYNSKYPAYWTCVDGLDQWMLDLENVGSR